MLRDADGDQFFGFCGMRVYVPDDDPRAEGIAEGLLRRFRERLKLAEPAIRARSTVSQAPASAPADQRSDEDDI